VEKIKSLINPGVIIAFLIYVFTVVVLYFVEYRLFGGAVTTFIIVYAIVLPILGLLHKVKKPRKIEWSKLVRIVELIVICVTFFNCVLICAFIFMIPASEMNLNQLHLLAIAVAFIITTVMEKQKNGKFKLINPFRSGIVSIVYSMILLSTLVFLLFFSPTTVYNSKQMLNDHGFQESHYVSNQKGGYVITHSYIQTGRESEVSDKELYDRYGAYLFKGLKDGREYGIFVGVSSGELIAKFDLEECTYLRGIIER